MAYIKVTCRGKFLPVPLDDVLNVLQRLDGRTGRGDITGTDKKPLHLELLEEGILTIL